MLVVCLKHTWKVDATSYMYTMWALHHIPIVGRVSTVIIHNYNKVFDIMHPIVLYSWIINFHDCCYYSGVGTRQIFIYLTTSGLPSHDSVPLSHGPMLEVPLAAALLRNALLVIPPLSLTSQRYYIEI